MRIDQKIVICGGHDTFLKALKGFLKGNVKYIDRERNFQIATLNNASEIWIQLNAISHPQYYRVTNYAKANGIPVRFFKHASARKCADQVFESLKQG